MAHHKSAIKRIRTNEKARLRNKSISSALKTAIKKWRSLLESGDFTGARTGFPKIESLIRHSASKAAGTKNKTSRSISRMTRELNRMEKNASAE